MNKKIITLGDIEIEKRKFRHRKNLILLEGLNTQKYRYLTWFLWVKNFKIVFSGYKNDDHKTKPLRIMLPKTSAYVKSYD